MIDSGRRSALSTATAQDAISGNDPRTLPVLASRRLFCASHHLHFMVPAALNRPQSVRLWLWLFAQNKRSPPHYAVNTKPVPSAAVRALQMIGLLLYFWSQQNIPFWIAECKWGLGFVVKARRFQPRLHSAIQNGIFCWPQKYRSKPVICRARTTAENTGFEFTA